MATFVLVHGSWHGSWCWERIAPLLDARGHRVVAPDLLGMGRDPTPSAAVTLAGWADQVAAVVRSQDEAVVLVGHSRGGIVISEAAERVPERIRRLVYLTAFLVPPGRTILEIAGEGPVPDYLSGITTHPDGTSSMTGEALRRCFYQTTPAEWAARAEQQVGREPMVYHATALSLTPERYGRVSRAYVECHQDRAIPLELQRRMQQRLPCDPVIAMDTDHSPFYSAPDELVANLVSLSAAPRASARG